MMTFAPSILAVLSRLQTNINLFGLHVGEALISLFERSENSYIVFRSNPMFKCEKGWSLT